MPAAKEVPGDRRADAQRRDLDDDRTENAIQRIAGRDAIEHQQHDGRGNRPDRHRVDRLVQMTHEVAWLFRLEAGEVGEPEVDHEGDQEHTQQLPAGHIAPERPHLLSVEQGDAKQESP